MQIKKLLKSLLALLGIAITINGIAMFIVSTFNIGNLLTLILGLVLTFWGIYFDKISLFIPLWIRCCVAFAVALALCLSSFLFIYSGRDNTTYKEDAIIVLGAGVNGSRVSLCLADRLETAIDYHKENPNALIIVSGGQGNGENLSEALAMEQYLVARGVNKEIIIKEDKSTSTYENFKFSKSILEKEFSGEYNIAYITNDYHIYRAGEIAKSVGLENLAHAHSNTRWHSVLPGVLRECLAVIKFWFFGN